MTKGLAIRSELERLGLQGSSSLPLALPGSPHCLPSLFVHWSQHARLERPFRRRLDRSIHRQRLKLRMRARPSKPLRQPLFQWRFQGPRLLRQQQRRSIHFHSLRSHWQDRRDDLDVDSVFWSDWRSSDDRLNPPHDLQKKDPRPSVLAPRPCRWKRRRRKPRAFAPSQIRAAGLAVFD